MSVEESQPERNKQRGRRAVADPKSAVLHARCTPAQRAEVAELAARSGMSVGAYLLAVALGTPAPRAARRPPIERRELARLLGETGKIGSNVNQIARACNRGREDLSAPLLAPIQAELAMIRDALMAALGREP